MTRAECISLWKAARAGDEAKLQRILVDSPDDVARNFINWKHHRKGTTPLMVAAECRHGEPAICQLIVAGADVNAEDDTKLKNTALHYAAMTSRDSLTTEALLEAGADAFALNRKGLSPLDLARQNRRGMVAGVLMEHMKVHSGWLYLRGKFRWKKRWGVVLACNKQRTSKELCVFRQPGDLRPSTVLLVDEAARASIFPSTDSFCWLKRENAFVFDKPVMCQCVKRQKFTRSPICRKTISHEDVQTRNLVFAADSYHSLVRWRRVLQSSNFYDQESGAPLFDAPLFDAPRGELYYWPQELVQNVRSSMLRQQNQQPEDDSDPLFERLRRTLELRNSQPAQEEEDPPLEDMLRGLQNPSEPQRNTPHRVRFASSGPGKQAEVAQPAQQTPPSSGSSATTNGSGSSEDSAPASGSQSTSQEEEQQAPSEAQVDQEQSQSSTPAQQEEEEPDLCGMCCSQRRNAVCAPCGHRAGCHACLRTVMHTSHACPYCRARVRSIMRVYD